MKERLNKVLEQKKVDALLVSCGYNMRYISGFTGATGYLYITSKKQIILTDSRYTTQAKNEAKDFEVLEISREKTYKILVKELVQASGVKKIGFENKQIGYDAFASFQSEMNNIEWVSLDTDLEELRVIKTQQEIDYTAMAASIADKAFSHILTIIRPGMTELDIAAELEYFMKKNGAVNLSFDSIIASGYNSALPHATPSLKKIEMGDFVTMDFGCIYEGYCSDMTRTIVIGKATDKQKELYQTVYNAQEAAFLILMEGKTGKEVDQAARAVIEKAGYGQYFGHGLGHSVGLYIHEDPRLAPSEEKKLKENMIVTVEPGIYIPEVGGVRIEELVVVKKGGFVCLSKSERKLIEL